VVLKNACPNKHPAPSFSIGFLQRTKERKGEKEKEKKLEKKKNKIVENS